MSLSIESEIGGASGFSGFSGSNGQSGASGFGIQGTSGFSGSSGFSGINGISGSSGFSGFSGGGIGSDTDVRTFTQIAHGFSTQEVLYVSGTKFALARSDVAATADAIGIVQATTSDTFDVVFGGEVSNMSGFSAGLPYYLSPLTAGKMEPTAPTTFGHINKPILFARTADKGIVQIQRGLELVPAQRETINFVIDGGGAVLANGEHGHIVVDYDAVIMSWTLLANQTGSVVIDIWKDVFSNFPPTPADSIIGGGTKPSLVSAQKNQETNLGSTGGNWATTSITKGDILAYNIDSSSTITRVTISLNVART